MHVVSSMCLFPQHDNRWNEWITFPIRYCDLPLNSQVTFTVWDIAGPRAAAPIGGSTFRLFGKKWYASEFLSYFLSAHLSRRDARSLRRGKHRLYLWPGREADGSNETSTPSKTGTRDEMGRLEKVLCIITPYALSTHARRFLACEKIRAR